MFFMLFEAGILLDVESFHTFSILLARLYNSLGFIIRSIFLFERKILLYITIMRKFVYFLITDINDKTVGMIQHISNKMYTLLILETSNDFQDALGALSGWK